MALDFTSAWMQDTSLSDAFDMTGGSTVHAFTIWVNVDAFSGGSFFDMNVFLLDEDISGDDGWGISMGDDPHEIGIFTQGGNTGGSASGMSAATWHHILGIYDQANTTVQIYVDNVQKFSDASYSDTSTIATGEIAFGRGDSGQTNYFDGKMAEAALLGVVPTADQRASLAVGFSPVMVMGNDVIEYWPMINDTTTTYGRFESSALTHGGSMAVAEHPPQIIHPSTPFINFGAAGAPPVGVAPTGHIEGPLFGSLGGPV